ncbi:MAG: uracil-DNA glycosylase, partial [Candidatus Aeolococcus gillhamiae]
MSEASNDAINAIQRDHRACVRCVGAGYLPRAHPVFSGHPGQRLMLVGQAPGPVEDDVTRPFAGRAGMQLMRWFAQAGFAGEHEVRERVFMTSMTTCFPGRLPNNAGDRRPTATEVALCRGWLDAYL